MKNLPELKLTSLRQAASSLHCGHAFLRKLVDGGVLPAWRRGGSEKRPRLYVNLEEAKRVVDRETRYVPPGFSARELKARQRARKFAALDPAVADL